MLATDTVTPISTATDTPGRPITVGAFPFAIAITPDGKTAYVVIAGSGTVTPIATATNTPGHPIPVGREPLAIAITPDGRTAYVVSCGPNTVTPIATTTNTPATRSGSAQGPRPSRSRRTGRPLTSSASPRAR